MIIPCPFFDEKMFEKLQIGQERTERVLFTLIFVVYQGKGQACEKALPYLLHLSANDNIGLFIILFRFVILIHGCAHGNAVYHDAPAQFNHQAFSAIDGFCLN